MPAAAKSAAMRKPANDAADPLATPSDLTPKQVAAVAEALNRLLADVFVLQMKTRNFHWHVAGPHFRDIHVALDEQVEQLGAAIDPLAERVRKLGAPTLRSLSGAMKASGLEENEADFVAPRDMLLELMEDNKAMAKALRAAHAVCDDNDDVASASLIEVWIDETEKRTWFLFEMSREV